MVLSIQRAAQKFRGGIKRSVPRTPMDSDERRNADHVWRMQMGRRPRVDGLVELMQLLDRLQVPIQPMIRHVAETAYEEQPNFGFTEFLLLLEQCKTLHSRWLAKVKGKKIDDEVLEAFIAVGGEGDSTGEVNVDLMDQIVNDFGLVLPELKDRRFGSPTQPSSPSAAASPEPAASPLSPVKRDGGPLEFDNFVALMRGRLQDDSVLTNMAATYLDDHDLDENDCDAMGNSHVNSRSGSRRPSLSTNATRRQTTIGNLPPISSTPQPHSPSAASHNNNHGAAERSHSSIGKGNSTHAVSKADRASVSPTRTAAKAHGVSRLPVINRQKREKKHKFANW